LKKDKKNIISGKNLNNTKYQKIEKSFETCMKSDFFQIPDIQNNESYNYHNKS
jgi:hypothetical protein